MPRVEIESLPPTSRTWLFGISPALNETQSRELLQQVDAFLDRWEAHGTPVTSARALIENSFLAIAVDERSETSGCSIDRMFGLLRQFEHDLGVQILDSNRVFVRHADGRVEAPARADFRDRGDRHTTIYDTLTERLSDLRPGHRIRKAEHARPVKRMM